MGFSSGGGDDELGWGGGDLNRWLLRRLITKASGSSDSTNDSSSGAGVVAAGAALGVDAKRLLVNERPFGGVSNKKLEDVLRSPNDRSPVGSRESCRMEDRTVELKNGGGGVGVGSIPKRPEFLKLFALVVLSNRVTLLKLSANEMLG